MPIYGALTFLLYLLPGLGNVLEMLRNIWEGLLIHSFLCLLMEYCGGESQCGEIISRDPAVLKHLWPLKEIKAFSLSEDIPLNVGFVKRCRMGTMQYAFVRPILAILSVVFRLTGIDKLALVAAFNWIVINVSVAVALYALGLFYLATKNHPGLAKANCLTKCVSLKMMVVFTFYQGCIISWCTSLERPVAEQLNTVLVLLELPFFAILLWKAYCVEEFILPLDMDLNLEVPAKSSSEQQEQADVESPQVSEPSCIFDERFLKLCAAIGLDADDIRVAGTAEGMEKIVTNASMALNMTDLFKDIYYNCSDKYRQHSLLSQATVKPADTESSDKASGTDPDANVVENFAEFEKEQNKQNMEEKANTLAKLQFL
ncbi:DUF300 domain-containing protein [Babesia ovata]|uniref:DUF300 domain-containing protein n=1 Tax=Babesia ovata TaxID=189622 RepID=A0A2H6KCC4_9APIC|nr:DUF300 domain-containing protein [Babesia ovata]GBE60648.1 DUF300 domain-containing protein [Babesia ovata]